MTVSKAQQRAVNKYMAANYDRVNLTMPKGRKIEIQVYAEAHGESVNSFINRAILETMSESHQKAAGTHGDAGGILTLTALEKAREGALKSQETVSAFIERAVSMQLERDKIILAMKERSMQDKKAPPAKTDA